MMDFFKTAHLKCASIVCTFLLFFLSATLDAVTINAIDHSNDLAESGGLLYVTPQGTYYSPSIGGYSYSYTTPYNIYDDGVYYDTGPVSGYYYSSPVGYGVYRPSKSYYSPGRLGYGYSGYKGYEGYQGYGGYGGWGSYGGRNGRHSWKHGVNHRGHRKGDLKGKKNHVGGSQNRRH